MLEIYDIDKLIQDVDIPFEEAISKDPTNLKHWQDYLDHIANQPHPPIASHWFQKHVFILHRATTALPHSKQLWNTYLTYLVDHSRQLNYTSHKCQFLNINKIFERAILNLPESIDIWKSYLQFLLQTQSNEITHIRRTINKCLRCLPLNQHYQIWPMYLAFADRVGGLTAIKIYSKYIQYLDPQELTGKHESGMNLEDIIYKFIEFGADDEIVIEMYQRILTKPDEYLSLPKSVVQYLFEYIDILMESSVPDLYFEDIIRRSISQYPDQVGKLYLKLTTFYRNRTNAEKVRYYYNKALKECLTVHDFTMIYDQYTEFEEQELNSLAMTLENDPSLASLFDFKMNKLEKLINNRELLLNDMMLRQNINNLDVWFTRFDIFKDDLTNLIKTYNDALKSINPLKVTTSSNHKLNQIWIRYASAYSTNGDYRTANFIYSKSILSQFNHPDELAELYINWCEMLLAAPDFKPERSIEILDEVLYREYTVPIEYTDSSIPVQKRITKSPKLWSFYIDLLESFIESNEQTNEIEKVCNAYDQLIKLKIATGKNIISYAEFLESWKYYERSLTIYERGLKLFQDSEIKYEIWKAYLTKTISSPIKIDIERIRDLFEICLDDIPPHLQPPIAMLYSEYEQKHGYLLNSIKILTRTITKLTQHQSSPTTTTSTSSTTRDLLTSLKLNLYITALAKIDQIHDVTQYAALAHQALQDQYLSPPQTAQLFINHILKFERRQPQSTTQKHRIRELFKYVTGLDHPDKLPAVWKGWEEYELDQGDEASFKDMLRIKRRVAGEFAQEKETREGINPMGFIKGKDLVVLKNTKGGGEGTETMTNPDQIDLDM